MPNFHQRLDALEQKTYDTGVYIIYNPELFNYGISGDSAHFRQGTPEDAARLAEQLPRATVVYVTHDDAVPGL